MPCRVTADMRRRQDHSPAESTGPKVIINLDKLQVTTAMTTIEGDKSDKLAGRNRNRNQNLRDEMKKWIRMDEVVEEEEERDEAHEMNDYKYLQLMAHKTNSRRRQWRQAIECTRSHRSSSWIIPGGGPSSLLARRTRTKLSKRRSRVRSFIMRKLSTLSQILFMLICLALISSAIISPWANCEQQQQPGSQQVGGTAANSSDSKQIEIQRSPRAAGGVVDLLATQRRARQQQTTAKQLQTTAGATNKVVDSAQFDIERKPQTGDNQNNNNNNNDDDDSSASVAEKTTTRTSGNYGEKQQRQHDDLSSSSTIDLNLTNSIEFNSSANGGSLSSGSIVVLASGRPKYENYPIDPSAHFDSAVQSPFETDDYLTAHGGQQDGMADVRVNDRQRAHESADLGTEQRWQQTNSTTTTTTGGGTIKQNFLDASLEAQAKLKDTVQQLHYNKSLGFERTTTAAVGNSSTSGTLLSPHALVDAPHEPLYQPADQSNLLPSSLSPANYLFAAKASDQLVSVSPTSAPSQLIEYANGPSGRDPLETAASADEVRQRQLSDSRALTYTKATDWGRRKSVVIVPPTSMDNELGGETASESQTRAVAPPPPPASSAYEDIVTWTPAAGPAAYRAGSGYQPSAQSSSSSQRANNLTTRSEVGSQPAGDQANSISEEPNESFYAPAARYSHAITTNTTNTTRRSDDDPDARLVPGSSRSTIAPSLTKRRHQRPQALAFKTRAPRVQPVQSVGTANRSLAPAYANRDHFGSDEADSRQSARYSDLAGRERVQRPGASVDSLTDEPEHHGLDRADSADPDERGPPIVPKAKRPKKPRLRVKVKQQLQQEPERNSIEESELEEDTREQKQWPVAPSRKVESEPAADEGQDQEERENEPPRVSSTTSRPAQVVSRKRSPSNQQVNPKTNNGRQWKQSSSNKQSKNSKQNGQGDRVQWSQLDVSGSSNVKAATEDGGLPGRLPVIRTFRLVEPKFSQLPLESAQSPPPPTVDVHQQGSQVVDSNALVGHTNQGLHMASKSFSHGATGTEPAQSHEGYRRPESTRPSSSFRPLVAPIGQFQAIEQTRRTNQQQQAHSALSANTNRLIGQEIDDQQQQQQQNWSVVVLPYPKPVDNAQSYFGSLPLPRHPPRPAASVQAHQQAFDAVAESAAQRYAAPAPPIVWPTQPANEVGQQLAVLHRQNELMRQQQQQQMSASSANKLIQRGTRDAPAEMRAPDNTLTINLSTHAASAVGPNQLFWEAAAREAAAVAQQRQQARSDAHKVPVSNGHTPPQHRESRQSMPTMRRPLAAMRYHQHQHHQNLAFGGDQAGSAPGGSVYPNDAYTNGHAYAGSTLKGPQLAAALDSLRNFNEFAHFQQASSNEFAFAEPLANGNHFYSFAGANPFETTPPQQQQQAAASDAFTSLLQQSGYGPAASFFPTSAQASAMAGGGGQTNNNSQFVKKGSAQLIASTPPMATPAGVRDPFGWPLAYGSQAAKSLLQINQVAPAPNYLIPSDKLKELAATSQQQQKSLRPTIENVHDLPSATSWNPNQAMAAAFPLWAAASAPTPVAVRPSPMASSGGDLATAASSSGPQNVMRVQISTRAPSRRERFWKRLRLFRRSPDGATANATSNSRRTGQSDDTDDAYLLEFDHGQQGGQTNKGIVNRRHKRSAARESLREHLVKSRPVVKLMDSLRFMRASNASTPTSKKSHAPHNSSSPLDLGADESQVHSQVVAPPPRLAMIDQDEPQAGHASSAPSGTRTAFIPLLDTSNLLDNLENDLLAQALLFSQRQHMQRLAAAGGALPATNHLIKQPGQQALIQQLESAPRAQFLLPAHSMQMVSHTPLYPSAPAGNSMTPYESDDHYNQLASSVHQRRPDASQYGMLMQAAASIHADGQHLGPPVNEPGSIPSALKDQQASSTGPRARIKQLSSQLMIQSRKPLTKLMQMTNFTGRFQPTVSLLKSAASPSLANTTGTQLATSASSTRPTAQKQQYPAGFLPFKMPLPGQNYQLFNQPLMMSHYLGGANSGAGGLVPHHQEMLMMMNQQQQQMAMQPSVTVSQHQQLMLPTTTFTRPPTLQAVMPFVDPPRSMGNANFNTVYTHPQASNGAPPPRVGATVIAGNSTHSYGNPMAAASNEASHLARFVEAPTSYNRFQQARLFAPANVPHNNQYPPTTSQKAHERADEIGQLISGLKLIKHSLQEKSSELTGDALRRAGGHHQYQASTVRDFRSQHHPHHVHEAQMGASRRQQVKVSPTLGAPPRAQSAQHHQLRQQQFVHQVSTSPSFKFVSSPPRPHQSTQNNNDEQAAALMAAAAATASQHEHDFSSYLSNFPQAAANYTDAEIFSSPSDQQPVELQATSAQELALANSAGGDGEQHQQQQNMIALDEPNSLLTGSGQDEEQRQQLQLINQQTQQQPIQQQQQQQQSGGNFMSQDEAQFQRQQQNAFLQMQQFGGSNVVQSRPRLPKFSIPSINSITSKFRQHLYQAFKLNPMGGGSSRWPTMLASPASYMSYQQQQPSGIMGTFPVQQQPQPQPQPQQVNFRPAGVQLPQQQQPMMSSQSESFNMEPSASNYYDVARQPPAHFQSQEFSMGPQQHQRVQMVRPPMMQMQQHTSLPTPINYEAEYPVISNRMPQQQQQQQQRVFVSSAPVSSIANQMPHMNNNNQQSLTTMSGQQHNLIMTDHHQYGNPGLFNQTTTVIEPGPYHQQVVGEQTISDNEIVGLDTTNGTQSLSQALLMAGGNNLTMTSQHELFTNQTLAHDEQQPVNPLQGALTEINGNSLITTSDESYIQEDQADLANQQQQPSLQDGGKAGEQVTMLRPESDANSSQTRQPEESQQQQIENIAIKSPDQQEQRVVISSDSSQRGRGAQVYVQQQQQMANNNTSGQEGSRDEQTHNTTIMLEPSGSEGGGQQQHYELERVVTTNGGPDSTSVRQHVGTDSRLPRPTKGRPSFSRPGQRQKQMEKYREVDYQVIRASSDISTSQQQQQSYMDAPQIVHLSNGTIDNHRQLRKLQSPLFKHAATRPVHQPQNQLQTRQSFVLGDGAAANETHLSQQQDIHETTTSDRFIGPIEEHEIDPNSLEYQHQSLHHHQSSEDGTEQQRQQPAQILHGTNQILVAAGRDQEQNYGHPNGDNEVEQQLGNQLAGRPLNWRINTTVPAGTVGHNHNASLQYDFRPVGSNGGGDELGVTRNLSTASMPSHEQFVLIDQPVILTGQTQSQVEPSQHNLYGQVTESQTQAAMATPALDSFGLHSNVSSSSPSGSEQPAVFVSIKPERVLQSVPQTPVASSAPSQLKGSQHQNRKRPLKMPKRAPANLQLVMDQRASESSGTSLRTNRPPGMIVPTNATTTTSSTTTTTSTTSRPTQARRANDSRNHNHKSAPSSSSSSLKDSHTRAPKARIRWQGAHHSPTTGGGLNDTTNSTISGNKTTTTAPTSTDAANDNQAAWIINGMTHQAYSSPRPPLNDPTQETSVTISQVPFNSSGSSSLAAAAAAAVATVASNHNYDGNRTNHHGQRTAATNHKLAGQQLATPASEPTSQAIPANHRAISTEGGGGDPPKGRTDSRTGSTSFKLSSGGGSGSHSSPGLLESVGPSVAANLSTPRPTTEPPRVNQLIDDSFLLASATESSQVALDQMLVAAASGATANSTTQVVSSAGRADQPAVIVRRSEPTGGEATSGNQTTLGLDDEQQDETTPTQTQTTTFDDAETFHAGGEWAREFAAARTEGEPRIAALAAANGKLHPLPGSDQLPLAVRIRMRQGQGQEELEAAATTTARLLSQSNETGGLGLDEMPADEMMMMMKHADR